MERYNLDAVNKTLTITAGFAKAMQTIGSKEYSLYIRLMDEIPGLAVVRKTHKTPKHYISASGEKSRCNQFKHMTYQNMENFINALPQKEAFMREFTFLRDIAAKVQTNRYALVRKWFVEQFPKFRENPMFYLTNTVDVVKGAEVIEEDQAADDAA